MQDSPSKTTQQEPISLIRDYLQAQSPEALIALLLNAADRDERFYQTLLRKAELAVGKTDVQKSLRKLITDATHIRGFVDWNEASDFAADLEQLVEALQELLTPEQATILIELAEYAIERVEDALENVDDSNGEVSGIIETLSELHLQACIMAKPEPRALAERLFHLEDSLSMGIASFDPISYQAVLGAAGLQRYRELTEAEWAKLKPRQPQDQSYDEHRFRITRLMEQLAEISGNLDELVAIKAHDLSAAYRYLMIAELWEKAGQDDKALDWAEQGLQAFPKQTDNRLRDFLVAAYLLRQRNDEALHLTWIQFEERPSLEHYKKLYCVAEPIGVWLAQRERALAKVAEVIATPAPVNRWQPQPATPNYSLRVAIALWEDDLQTAWTAAHQGACDQALLITLAEQLTSTRPDDAISLYQRVILPIVAQTNNTAYEEAVKLIRKIAKIMTAQQRLLEFQAYVAELRMRFNPKRNFIKLLDGLVV